MTHLPNVHPVRHVRLFLRKTALFDAELSQSKINHPLAQVGSVLEEEDEEGVLGVLVEAQKVPHENHLHTHQAVVAQPVGGTVPVFPNRPMERVPSVLHPELLDM